MTANKTKLSVTVSPDLLAQIDEEIARAPEGATRSAVVERWLREASQRRAVDRLAEETARYYRERTSEQREDDEDWAAVATSEYGHAPTRRRK